MVETISYLQKLGLTKSAAKILDSLFCKEKCTARELSDLTGIPYTKIYQNLTMLEKFEYVRSDMGKPKYFWAPDPEEFIDMLIAMKQSIIDRLLKEKEEKIRELVKTERNWNSVGMERKIYWNPKKDLHISNLASLKEVII